MALIPFYGAYQGPEYDTTLGQVGFVNYGTNVSNSAILGDFPCTICLGFAGQITYGSISRDFISTEDKFQYFNINTAGLSSELIIPASSSTAFTTYTGFGGNFTFSASDRLQFLCTQGSGTLAQINVNLSSWAEIPADTNDYFTIVASTKGPYNSGENPFSYGGGASEGVAATSTTGFTLPFNCELTFGGITVSSGGRDVPLSGLCRVNILQNGGLVDAIIVPALQTQEIYTTGPLSFSAGDIFSLESASTNADLVSWVGTFTFRIT